VRCCDAFSAMTTDRSYRKAMPVAEAIADCAAAPAPTSTQPSSTL
jgi:HD-GYP domain-containing protein (c-di-GMP phosphodiesterase class II)